MPTESSTEKQSDYTVSEYYQVFCSDSDEPNTVLLGGLFSRW